MSADHTMRLPVTVCIPVRNEERNLRSCLSSLAGRFVEIVVVDSGSVDKSRQIAEVAGAKVLDFRWDGQFPKKRNWTLRNHDFKTPWVLFLDADERVTAAFVDALHRALPDTPHVGFWVCFDNWFMGRALRHGDVFRKLALFRVGAGGYERLPEDHWSHLDMEVHEPQSSTARPGKSPPGWNTTTTETEGAISTSTRHMRAGRRAGTSG